MIRVNISSKPAIQDAAVYAELRGFVKLKYCQKSEENSEVSGWVKPQLGFEFFSDFWIIFTLTRPLTLCQRRVFIVVAYFTGYKHGIE